MSFKKSKMKEQNRLGFTLVEIMVTVLILSVGIVSIYQIFFKSLNVLHHLTCRVYAENLLTSKIAEFQQKFQDEKAIPFGSQQLAQRVKIDRRFIDFEYSLSLKSFDRMDELYELSMSVSWAESGSRKQLSQTIFITHFVPQES